MSDKPLTRSKGADRFIAAMRRLGRRGGNDPEWAEHSQATAKRNGKLSTGRKRKTERES